MAEKIEFDASGFSGLKAQIREANLEYQALLSNIDATPEAITAAADKVAGLKDQFNDANDAINALTQQGKFQALTKGLAAVSGGFTAVQGAITLVGGDVKDFEKTFQQLQAAMALTQGLTALADLGDAFGAIKIAAVGAFNGIKAAIGSTGIGLLILGIGIAVQQLTTYLNEASAAEKKNATETKNLTAQLEGLDAAYNALNLDIEANTALELAKATTAGKSEAELTKIKKKGIQDRIDLIDQESKNQTQAYSKLFKVLRENGKTADENALEREKLNQQKSRDGIKLGTEKFKLQQQLLIEDELLKQKNNDAQDKRTDKQKAKDAKDKAEADALKEKEDKKKEDAEKDSIAKTLKANKDKNEALRKLDDAKATEGLDAITTEYANNLSRLKEEQAEELKQDNLTGEAKAAINAKYSALILANEALRQKDTKDLTEKTAAEILAIEQKAKDDKDKLDKEERDKKFAAAQATIELASSTVSQILSLEQAALQASLANENLTEEEREKIAKESFEKQKKLQIALALIDSAKTVTSILAEYPKFDGGIAMFAALATTAVTLGFAIAKIQAVQYQSPNKTSSSKSSSQQGSMYAQGGLLQGNSHNLGGIRTSMGELEGGEFVMNRRATANFLPLLESINSIGNTKGPEIPETQQPIFKTYVVASEMTSQQEANAKLSALARI